MEPKPDIPSASLTPDDEDTTLQTSSSNATSSPPVPALTILREKPYANSMPGPDSEEPVRNSASRQSTAPATLQQSLAKIFASKNKRVVACVLLGAATMAFVVRVGQVVTQDNTTACDTDLVAFMKDLNLASLAPEICSRGYTRLADLLHMSPETYDSDDGSSHMFHVPSIFGHSLRLSAVCVLRPCYQISRS